MGLDQAQLVALVARRPAPIGGAESERLFGRNGPEALSKLRPAQTHHQLKFD